MAIKWAALASGEGTTLDYFYDKGLTPDLVVVDRDCQALSSANYRTIQTALFRRRGRFTPEKGCDGERVDYTLDIRAFLKERGIELVVMAGWMPVFSAEMFEGYAGHVLNLHPSHFRNGRALFPGDYKIAVGKALSDYRQGRIADTGSTVHVATAELDTGPALGQSSVLILPSDDITSLHSRMKIEEKPLYEQIVRRILAGKIDL